MCWAQHWIWTEILRDFSKYKIYLFVSLGDYVDCGSLFAFWNSTFTLSFQLLHLFYWRISTNIWLLPVIFIHIAMGSYMLMEGGTCILPGMNDTLFWLTCFLLWPLQTGKVTAHFESSSMSPSCIDILILLNDINKNNNNYNNKNHSWSSLTSRGENRGLWENVFTVFVAAMCC